MIKFSFFLMTRKGYLVLEEFIKQFGHACINCVVTSQDRNIKKDYYEEIKEICAVYSIPCYDKDEIYEINDSICFTISWRWIVEYKKGKLIILHDSLLPKYRGFAPLVSCLINGAKTIGVTALWAEEEYDTGAIIAQKSISIDYPIKIADAIDKVVHLYVNLVLDISRELMLNKNIPGMAQNEAEASYCLWRNEDDYRINWNQDAFSIQRFIDAVGEPYKGAFSFLEKRKVRLLDAQLEQDVKIENREPGKIIFMKENLPVIVCQSGLLKINSIIDDETGQSVLPFKKLRSKFL